MQASSATAVRDAVTALQAGRPIMIFDSGFREAETDLVFPAASLQPADVRRLRSEAGGLLFLAIGHEVAEAIGMPFLEDVYRAAEAGEAGELLRALRADDLRYDSRSAFSLSINHRETLTGIPDGERCLTSRRFCELAVQAVQNGWSRDEAIQNFGREFRSPGHVWVCREAEGGLTTRKGHTELMVAAARLAGVPPILLGAEFLDPQSDRALHIDDSRRHAKQHGIPLVEGHQLEAEFARLKS